MSKNKPSIWESQESKAYKSLQDLIRRYIAMGQTIKVVSGRSICRRWMHVLLFVLTEQIRDVGQHGESQRASLLRPSWLNWRIMFGTSFGKIDLMQ